jgi:hypothetical protein
MIEFWVSYFYWRCASGIPAPPNLLEARLLLNGLNPYAIAPDPCNDVTM